MNLNIHWLKKERMLVAKFSVSGSVSTDCDRCNSPMNLQISNNFQIIYTFGIEAMEDENIIVIPPDEFEINVKEQIYELISLAIPNRKIHPTGECDEEMYELVKRYTVNFNEKEEDIEDEYFEDDEEDDDFEDEDEDDSDDNDDIDPKWSILKNLN